MKKYKANDVVSVIVSKIEPYGAFVKAENNYVGLIHISEINGKYINNINNYFKEGKEIVCRITGVDEERKHLKLSMIDIDSRINYNQKNELEETKIGFSELERRLPGWIKDKENEMNRTKNKKNSKLH